VVTPKGACCDSYKRFQLWLNRQRGYPHKDGRNHSRLILIVPFNRPEGFMSRPVQTRSGNPERSCSHNRFCPNFNHDLKPDRHDEPNTILNGNNHSRTSCSGHPKVSSTRYCGDPERSCGCIPNVSSRTLIRRSRPGPILLDNTATRIKTVVAVQHISVKPPEGFVYETLR
jgi:hypothetical protein